MQRKDLEAKLVDITGEGTNYSIIISGDDTGFTNGFRITGDARWETRLFQMRMLIQISSVNCHPMHHLN